jgi:hypothetical protein
MRRLAVRLGGLAVFVALLAWAVSDDGVVAVVTLGIGWAVAAVAVRVLCAPRDEPGPHRDPN